MKFPNVPSTSVKLMLFPFSLEGAARIWLEKEPPRSILTWDDLVSKFINQFFPPSKTTNLRNEITRFQQRFDESFYEAWDRFNDLLRACPHHGFSELHQLDTFYNALNSNDLFKITETPPRVVTLMDKMSRVCLKTHRVQSTSSSITQARPIVAIVSTSFLPPSISPDVAELKDMVKALLLDKKNQSRAPAAVKAVEESCVTCGGAHSHRNCPTTDGNVYRDNIQDFPPVKQNQGNNQNRYNQNRGNNYNQSPIFRPPVNQPPAYQAPSYQAPAPQAHGVSKADFESYVKANDAVMQNMQSQMTNITDLLTKFVNSNTASTSGSGSLPSNTIANPKGDVKAITTRSGVSYNGPQIPPSISSLPKEMENEPEVTKDTVQPSTENIQPPVVQTNDQIGEPVVASKTKPTLPYPSRANKEKLREKDDLLASKFMEIFRNLHFELSFADALIHMPKFAPMFRKLLNDKDKIIELTKTPDVFVKVGTFFFPADFVVVDYVADPRVPLILGRPFLRTARALIDVHGEQITLRHDDQSVTFKVGDIKTFSYNIIESVNRVDVINIACEEYVQEVLEISESGNPTSPSDLMIDSRSPSFTPFGGSDFLMEEIDAFLEHDDSIPPGVDGIYDSEGDTVYLEELLSVINSEPNLSPSPVCEINVPEKIKSSCEDPPDLELKDLPSHLEYAFLEGDDKLPVIIAKNLKDEDKPLLIMRRVNPKIHEVIKQEVIKLLDAGLIYPISDSPWVSPVHCVPKKGGITVVKNEENELIPTRLVTGWRVCIDYRKLNDATRKDHFSLPFMDQMLERLAENKYYCFLDGFSSYFQIPIDPLDQEKTTFTCPYGTFAYRRMPFGLCNAPGTFQSHKISKSGIEVDKAKVDVIAKLPHPTTVKETPFIFSKECIEAFETLKLKLTQAPILVAPDWDLPFEIMCDASDFAVRAVTRTIRPLIVSVAKQDSKQGLLRWILLLQEFDVVIRDKKGAKNLAADHLSRLENPIKIELEKKEITETFSSLRHLGCLCYFSGDDIAHGCRFFPNYHAGILWFKGMSSQAKKRVFQKTSKLLLGRPPSCLRYVQSIDRRCCCLARKALDILEACHNGPTGGHHGANLTAKKVEAKALPTNDARVVCKFLKSLFAKFGAPRAIISDHGTHFCNDQFAKVMLKYGVTHRLSTAYHPQTSGQVEVSNCGLKRILERTIGENRASWSDKLDDALWTSHTAYKTPIECTPYKLVYGKACHLPIELEHKAYWALKHANFDLVTAGDHRKDVPDFEASHARGFCPPITRASHPQLHLGIQYLNLID
ncbi:reverse transcriptase domain-containing protein [Tanacetum coccineum]